MVIILIVLFLLFGQLLIENGFLGNPSSLLLREIHEIEIEDICGPVTGRVIHTISDEGSCKNACVAECESSEGSLKGIKFSEISGQCNKCQCYCRY